MHNNPLTPEEVWKKIRKYCDWQERCHQEVRRKLYDYGLRKTDVEEMLVQLIEANLLNEERFSRAYAGGKFRTKKWGRNRIIRELESREISNYCIEKALSEIDDQAYESTLIELINQKQNYYKETNVFIRNGKVAKYCINKGYEPNLVWELIKEGAA